MSVTLAALLSDSTEKTRNSTTGTLDNTKRTRAINRVLQDLQDFADWDFTRRQKTFYFIDGVTEYSLQNYVDATCLDNDGSTEIGDFKNPYDLRPTTAGKSLGFKEAKDVRENIRRNRSLGEYAIDNGVLVINYPRQTSLEVHNCDSLTANGTWAASGNATNLTIDEVNYHTSPGSLNFDTSAGTSLILTNSSLTSMNLETLQNTSHLTMQVWLPTITNFSSIRVRLGSSSGAYWEKTETAPAGSATLATGKNLFAFRWADATETGSPDWSAVDYIQIVITYSSGVTATDFRIDDIRIGQEVEMELDYYSLAMAQNTSGTYQLEFNPDAATSTDVLLGAVTARRTVIQGTAYELFEIIGGKSERDRTDSYKIYERKRSELFARCGRRLRRPSRVLNFPSRRSTHDTD